MALAGPAKIGRAKRIEDAQGRYIEVAKPPSRASSTLAGLRIVVDCANGAAYRVAPDVLWELGAEVIADRRRAERLQHQRQLRLDRTRRAAGHGA